MLICKLNAENNWMITFYGSVIVEKFNFEPTGKSLGEYGESDVVNFWLENLKNLTQEHRLIIEFHKLEYSSNKYINCTALNFP